MKEISVILTTYNHGRFIEQCISSILGQRNLSEVEIVWHDDCSNDDTRARGDALLSAHDVTVKRIFRQRNRYQNRIPITLDILEAAEGKYISLLEGDDFWINEHKLTLQKLYLEQNPTIDLCFARAPIVDFNSQHTSKFLGHLGESVRLVLPSEVIRGGGGFMHTGSIFMRKHVFDKAPGWVFEYLTISDYVYQVLGAIRGGAIYLPHDLSCWRSQNPQSLTGKYQDDQEFQVRFDSEFLQLLRRMQVTLDQKFRDDFDYIMFGHLISYVRKIVDTGSYDDLANLSLSLMSIDNREVNGNPASVSK